MKTYEMLYVLDTAVSDEGKDAFAKRFEDIVAAANGKVVSADKWGVKRLAYPIRFKHEGYYVLLTFEAESSAVKELDRVAGLSSEILRRVITIKN